MASDPTFYVYLDQNVLSDARQGKDTRLAVLDFLDRISAAGGNFVISEVNVDESRASGRPETFLEVVSRVGAAVIVPYNREGAFVPVSSATNEELFMGDADIVHDAQKLLERLLVPLHFASGWLGKAEASELKAEITHEIDLFWEQLAQGIPEPFSKMLYEQKRTMLATLDDLEGNKMKLEAGVARHRLAESLKRAGIVPTELEPRAALDSILSHLQDEERRGIQAQYPSGFWKEWLDREHGHLTGFSFMLFLLGLIDDKTTRTKGLAKRRSRFLTHFRDCAHIEAASYCQVFITCDSDAARMAKAVYDYSGASTTVQHIRITQVER